MRVKTLPFLQALLPSCTWLPTYFVLALVMELNTAPQLNKMAEHNLGKKSIQNFSVRKAN